MKKILPSRGTKGEKNHPRGGREEVPQNRITGGNDSDQFVESNPTGIDQKRERKKRSNARYSGE